MPLPEPVRPMLAVAGELPPENQEHRWAYEMKWDGVRAVVYVGDGRVRVLTRNDNDVTAAYPEVSAMAAALGARQVVLDGELVALDDVGRPSFSLLQRRMHVANPAQVRSLTDSVPVLYFAFDLLHLDGHDLTGLSYDERRSLLEALQLDGERWTVPPAFVGRGSDALRTSHDQRLEGVVAKRRDSTYAPGRRNGTWVKVKHVLAQEVVIGGWREGNGRRSDTIGGLLLGVPGEDGLEYVGKVGTGFTDAMLTDLQLRLARIERRTSPFARDLPRVDARDAVWVTPTLVGEVAFTEWTPEGRLRHPAWRGLRPDKSPTDVVRE